MHGGKTPRGVAAPNFVHGRYSKSLPSRMLAQYEAALGEADLLNLTSEIALVETRLADVLSRVDAGESARLWKELKSAKRQFLRAQDGALNALLSLIDAGHADHQAWHEVLILIDQRRRLAESERARLVQMQQLITSDQAMTLVTALVDAIRKHVDDRPTLAAIQNEFDQLLNRRDPVQLEPEVLRKDKTQ